MSSCKRKSIFGVSAALLLGLGGIGLISGCKSQRAEPQQAQVQSAPSSEGCPKDYTGLGMDPSYRKDDPKLYSWVDCKPINNWAQERYKRQQAIFKFVGEEDESLNKAWKFNLDEGQNARVAWKWFEESPLGFGGVPFVLLMSILAFDDNDCKNFPALCPIQQVWRKKPSIGGGPPNIDHMGFAPNPRDYVNGQALPPGQRKFPLPYGLVFQANREPSYKFEEAGPYSTPLKEHVGLSAEERADKIAELQGKLRRMQVHGKALVLLKGAAGKAQVKYTALKDMIRQKIGKPPVRTEGYANLDGMNFRDFQKPQGFDRVFFSCAGCHVGRVIVDNKVKHLWGAPNTEAEAQYFSRLLMQTGALLVKSGFDTNAKTLQKDIKPNSAALVTLYKYMLQKVRKNPEIFYGKSDTQKLRALTMAERVASNFPLVAAGVIGTAVKTHYIYQAVAGGGGYDPHVQKARLPDLMDKRAGSMDAFGIASGLVALHGVRPDNSYMRSLYDDVFGILGPRRGESPAFVGFPNANSSLKTAPGGISYGQNSEAFLAKAGKRIFDTVRDWQPPVPGPADIKGLNWVRDATLANWDGNQGAEARTLASGTSSTGDPRKVNVQIHEPMNPFIENLPPAPYPFSVDLQKAGRGKKIYFDKCAGCHTPNRDSVVPVSEVGTDPNRALVNNDVSRNLLAGLVLEACTIFVKNRKAEGRPNDYCLPPKNLDQKGQLDNYFDDVGGRQRQGIHGYKADMLHGIWATAPYLHNGSVPSLAHLICPSTRPAKFIRGNINYDQDLLGFEWAQAPTKRYGQHDMVHFVEYDTRVKGRSNRGHTYGKDLCPTNLTGSRAQVARAIKNSPAGDLLEYLKTL